MVFHDAVRKIEEGEGIETRHGHKILNCFGLECRLISGKRRIRKEEPTRNLGDDTKLTWCALNPRESPEPAL
jgi:hypothetical protein